jgi:NitT/TauT family transport system ATP-binding protein
MTAQPGCVKRIIDVPFQRPRSVLELRAQPEYGEFVYSIWGQLREEVERVRSRDLGETA